LKSVLVDFAVLHDDGEILLRIAYEIDILEGVAVDQQQVGIVSILVINAVLPNDLMFSYLSPFHCFSNYISYKMYRFSNEH